MKERLDRVMVRRGLAPTREKAHALILAGKVRVAGEPARKAGSPISEDAPVEVLGPAHPYVSRGGVKLAAALDAFALDVAGWAALDIGASTGGFTHCLLLRGARRVHAVDVGYGQLAWELRQDPRVVAIERTNIRNLPGNALDEPVQLAVMDVSFISLRLVLEHALRFLRPGGHLLALVKPQFEAGREQVRRGGRVTDEDVHRAVLGDVRTVGEALGLTTRGETASPIAGKKSGNREFFLWWQAPGDGAPPR